MTAPASEGRLFDLGQVLTLACSDTDAQQLFCSYAELLDVLGYMLADVPMADDIPDAIERCRPVVLEQHPDLAGTAPPLPLASDTEVLTWLADQAAEHGTKLALRPLTTREEA